jgi:4-diphosphocytidyl-2-C-methyl-D-erythritol kinase
MELGIKISDLAIISKNIGADVPFFVYDYNSANVRGIGENVEEFIEEDLDLEIITPNIKCNTKAVFEQFRNFHKIEPNCLPENIFSNTSKQIILNLDPLFANDLLAPACEIYPELSEFAQDGWFFSGSGSSFFRIK